MLVPLGSVRSPEVKGEPIYMHVVSCKLIRYKFTEDNPLTVNKKSYISYYSSTSSNTLTKAQEGRNLCVRVRVLELAYNSNNNNSNNNSIYIINCQREEKPIIVHVTSGGPVTALCVLCCVTDKFSIKNNNVY